MIIDTIQILKAEKGFRLTDGEVVYAETLLLPENRTADEFTEISEAEYQEMLEQRKEKLLGGIVNE